MDGVDMISKLPDPILQLILSGLPSTEEVIRTSILSQRWRHLWTSIPSIDIDSYRGQNSLYRRYVGHKFEEFVYWVLATNSFDLDSFRLCCTPYCHKISTIERWIRIAVMRRVKLVDLKFCPKEWYSHIELPHCLLTCRSLEVLKLFLYNRRLNFPLYTGFPTLRVLELNSVKLTDGGLVQHFLESCPCLEELSFIHCMLYKLRYLSISCPKLKKLRIDNRNNGTDGFLYSGVWISCPKLVFLEFVGYVAVSFSIDQSLDSLKKAVIHLEDLDQLEIDYDPRGDSTIRSLCAQISHAEFLSLSHYFIKELGLPVSLPNLKTLELTTILDADIMDVLIKFLTCVPHLESLHLIIRKGYFTDKHWNLDKAEERRILAPRLKRVEFLEFKREKQKLDIVRSLLKHGNVLEEMVFNWENYCRGTSMKTMKTVSKFHKASSTVKLITLFKD